MCGDPTIGGSQKAPWTLLHPESGVATPTMHKIAILSIVGVATPANSKIMVT